MSALTIPVQIKTAAASGQVPTSLLPGELGLDPWLGRLWWADNNGAKQSASLPSIAAAGGAPSAVDPQALPYAAVAADKGKQLVLTGSGALSLPAATQAAGWWCWVKKADGNGQAMITPTVANGMAPTIEGLASICMYQESYIVWWDAANGVFRTAGRPKGIINMGSTAIAGGSAALQIVTGFNDPELRDITLDAENIVFSAADQLGMRVQKSGTYQTANYTGSTFYYGQSTGTGSPSSFVNLGGQGTTAAGATVTLWGFGQNTGTQRIEGASISANFAGISQTYQTNVAPITGVQFFGAANGANLSSGTFNQRGYRP